MAKGKFKCTKCERSFSMPAHLARHESAMHSAKPRSKGAGPKRGKRRGRPPKASVAVPTIGGEALELVQRMQGYHADLLVQRQGLDDRIAAIASAMDAMGTRGDATPARRGPGRPKGSGGQKGSLATHIVRALKSRSRPMGPAEIARLVMKGGYTTKSQNLTKVVSNTLRKLKVVKRVGFGEYKI